MKLYRHSQTLLLLTSVLIFTSSCVEQFTESSEIQIEQTGMDALLIPDGFDFNMSKTQGVNVGFQPSNGRVAQEEALQFAIFGVDLSGEIHSLKIGYATLAKGISTTITKPIHIEQLYMNTKYKGNSRFFELNEDNLVVDETDLIVDDGIFESSNGRTKGTPSCTSFLGNATKISCKNNVVVIKSSASFLHVDIEFSNGVLQRFQPGETGSVNANQNQWEFTGSIGTYSLVDAVRFTVYADCKTSPRQVSEEMATFMNPCQEMDMEQDEDQDGVPDHSDVSPSDPSVAAVSYFPALDKYATFAFEDMWPFKGDYDFNDLVVSHQASIYTNAFDFVTKVDYQFQIRAIGAIFDNDLCINFSDPEHQVFLDQIIPKSIQHEIITLDSKTELRFSHIRDVFGRAGFINTDTTKVFYEPIRVSFTALFNGKVRSDDFEIDEYLRINQEEGREVHKSGRPYTSLADKSMFGTANDDTNLAAGKLYKSKDNLPWVLEIPTEWEYPKEKVKIIDGYPKFKDFAQGKTNSPWYTDDAGNKIHKHLYRKKN
ncbi:MAG: LruC domain-containing protein [Cyclobacteriaceae bacterium]|jgi:LruC domain-containing protein